MLQEPNQSPISSNRINMQYSKDLSAISCGRKTSDYQHILWMKQTSDSYKLLFITSQRTKLRFYRANQDQLLTILNSGDPDLRKQSLNNRVVLDALPEHLREHNSPLEIQTLRHRLMQWVLTCSQLTIILVFSSLSLPTPRRLPSVLSHPKYRNCSILLVGFQQSL